MDDTLPPSHARARGLVILALTVASVLVYVRLSDDARSAAIGSEILVLVASTVSAIAIALWAGRWPGGRAIAAMWGLIALAELVFLVTDLVAPGSYGPRASDVLMLTFLVPLAYAMRAQYGAHFEPADSRALTLDVVVISMSLAAIVYVLMRPGDADGPTIVSVAIVAIVASGIFTAFAALALWVPSRPHLMLCAAATLGSAAIVLFGIEWTRGTFDGSSAAVDLSFLLAPYAFAATMTTVSHGSAAGPSEISRLARPMLTSAAVLAACGALLVVTILDEARELSHTESIVLVLVLGGAIAVRMIANQSSMAQAQLQMQDALTRREAALDAADRALARVRDANETHRRSEEHLRSVFDGAVDGLVELDAAGAVVRSNDAFASMVGVDRASIEGQGWDEVAARVIGADASFAQLPETGEGRIDLPEGQIRYLESRTSVLPTSPPRRLLVIRDVTAAKVTDRTIRSLFQFLQDRDEDRTRLLRRTNAAIEQERNRIARDLHDGPVQGVSAASLSLEAALLMLKSGDVEGTIDVLTELRREIAGEANALRRLMAGLRPPVLEERGLIPALRDSLMRFGTDQGLQAEFGGQLKSELPADLETLAYRVVQEALANVGKHADASHVSVYVGSDQTQLRIEIEDDGKGFDTANAREFLASGRVGLASMRERVELASGTFAVRSTPGRGTAVMATIPLDAALVAIGVS
jgi:PAS domain S-box-containing protein